MALSDSLSLVPSHRFLLSLLLPLLFALLFFISHIFFTPSTYLSFSPLSATSSLFTTYLAKTPTNWLSFLQSHPHTERLGCREYSTGSQSCVYAGLACIDASNSTNRRPVVYFIDDSQPDFDPVPHDDWCATRNSSTDPRYHASYYFEHLNHTFAPRRACLDAYFRTTASLLGSSPRRKLPVINWRSNLWLVDLEFPENDHNPSLFTDLLWILDVAVWQNTWDIRDSPFTPHMQPLFQTGERSFYLPQTRQQFDITQRNVYRLIYAMILQLDLKQLFPDLTAADLSQPPESEASSRSAQPLFDAYPQLKDSFVFHGEQTARDDVELVCTPRLSVGAKVYDGAHERVCRNLRQQGYDLFGIKLPPLKGFGQVRYAPLPKRVMILQRHDKRRIGNVEELVKGLQDGVGAYDVEIEVVSTNMLKTAEDWVRVMASAGVVISVHGSHLVGQIWMKRHRYVFLLCVFCKTALCRMLELMLMLLILCAVH